MPGISATGISGQFFKSFGYTVVIAVLMSLFVARMITPLIAAYFLKSHGVQEHASGKAMDKYLGILKWSLDTSKAEAARAALPDHRGRWYHYVLGGLMILVRVVAFFAGVGITMKLL